MKLPTGESRASRYALAALCAFGGGAYGIVLLLMSAIMSSESRASPLVAVYLSPLYPFGVALTGATPVMWAVAGTCIYGIRTRMGQLGIYAVLFGHYVGIVLMLVGCREYNDVTQGTSSNIFRFYVAGQSVIWFSLVLRIVYYRVRFEIRTVLYAAIVTAVIIAFLTFNN